MNIELTQIVHIVLYLSIICGGISYNIFKNSNVTDAVRTSIIFTFVTTVYSSCVVIILTVFLNMYCVGRI